MKHLSLILSIVCFVANYGAATEFVDSSTRLHYTVDANVQMEDEITITGYSGSSSVVVIPAHFQEIPVVKIGNRAFFNKGSVNTVILPNTIKSIESYAFDNSGITNFTIPKSVTEIQGGAFSGTLDLESYNVETGSTSYSSESGVLFDANKRVLIHYPQKKSGSFYDIPSSVEGLRIGSFTGAIYLKSVNIPASTTYYGSAFRFVPSLEVITVDESNMHFSSVDGVLYTKSGTTLLRYPTAKPGGFFQIPEGVEIIGTHAFYNCDFLNEISFASTTTSLEMSAFSGSGLKEVSVPESITTIGIYTFRNCRSLEKAILPSSLSTVTRSMFMGCESLREVFLPDSLTKIDAWAFAHCDSLEEIFIPKNVSSIVGPFVFAWSEGLQHINVDPENTSYRSMNGVLLSADGKTLIRFPGGRSGHYTIPSSVEVIGDRSFLSTPALVSVLFHDKVHEVQPYAFASCNSLHRAVYQGDAPVFQNQVHVYAAEDFAIHYHPLSFGFSTPTWNGYPAEPLTGVNSPFQFWLAALDLPPASSPSYDSNSNGISLLLEYALNLDPSQELSTRLPALSRNGSEITYRFYGQQPGITYRVLCSNDLVEWENESLILSLPDNDGMVTATVNMPIEGRIFFRLEVTEDL